MGCFSFICKECGQPILSNSFRGQPVKLFLLKDGQVIEQMEGEYDSYGRVFNSDRTDSLKWSMEWRDVCDLMTACESKHFTSEDYDRMDEETGANKLYENVSKGINVPNEERFRIAQAGSQWLEDNRNTVQLIQHGIAAIHTKCWKGNIPTTRSEDDPNQGWGEDLEFLGSVDNADIL